jgi:hypothetical protein
MPEEMNRLPDELHDVERLLRSVAPAPCPNRDRVLYEAGRTAGVRTGHRRLWQGLCAVLAAACAGLLLFPRERIVERVVVKHQEISPQVDNPPRVLAQEPAQGEGGTVRPVDELEAYLELRAAAFHSRIDLLRDRGGGEAGTGGGGGGSGGGGAKVPALRPGDGLDSLPLWQKRAALSTGERS